MSQPFFSVVLPVYNAQTYLGECIESVLTQTFTDWELIIVDDASMDATPDILRRYAGRDPRIKVLRNEKNMERSFSANRAVRASAGEWIARIDGDDRYHPGFLGEVSSEIRKNGDSHCFYTALVRIIDDAGKTVIGEVSLPGAKKVMQMILRENVICHSASCYPKALWEKVGGYAATQTEPDDLGLWKRFLREDVRLVIIRQALVDYRIHFSNTTLAFDLGKSSSEMSRNEMAVRNKEWKIPIFLRQGMLQDARRDLEEIFRLKSRKKAKDRLYYLLTFFPARLVRFIMWEIRPRIIGLVRRPR